MAKLVLYELSFLFDPGETWTQISEFDTDFGKFLETKGLLGETVQTMSPSTRKVIQIVKKPEIIEPQVNTPVTNRQPGQILKTAGQRTGFDGKFRKSNG